jgi:hypothetical protein
MVRKIHHTENITGFHTKERLNPISSRFSRREEGRTIIVKSTL